MVADLQRQQEEEDKPIVALEESIHLVGPSATDGHEIREREICDCDDTAILDSDSRTRAQSVMCKDTRRMFPPLDSILSNAGHVGRLPDSNLSFGNWRDNLARPVFLRQASGAIADSSTRPRPVGEFDTHPQMMNYADATDMFLSAPGSSSASRKNNALLIQDFVSKVTAEEEENVIQLYQNTRLSVNVGYKCLKLSEITIFRVECC